MTTKSRKRPPRVAKQTFEQRYYVTRAFDYGDRRYKQGEVFEPSGNRRDRQIMDYNCRLQHVTVEVPE